LLFDLMPKARREDLFDFDEELSRLTKLLGDSRTRLIVVKGLRRTGKTSLILTALNSIASPYAFIDVREVVRSRRGLYMALERAINDLLRLRSPLTAELRRALEAVRGVRVAGLEVSLSWGRDRPTVSELLRELEEAASRVGFRLPLVIDEAQRLVGPIGHEVWSALAHAYDFLEGLVIVLSGSEVGVLEGVLGDPGSPLYGRAYAEVNTRRLSDQESLEFLRRGFREVGVSVPEAELEEAVRELDGVVGWLTYYGYERSIGGKDLEEVVREAVDLARRELEDFMATRASRRYRAVLRLLASGVRGWGELKRELERREGREVSERALHEVLGALRRHSIVDERLEFTDPIVRRAAEAI
jgi:hypothetical protein